MEAETERAVIHRSDERSDEQNSDRRGSGLCSIVIVSQAPTSANR